MNVDLGLLGYLPLPFMPFDKVNPAPTEKKRIIEETHKSVDRKADAFRYESIYA
jgi:hypothetical protein